MVMQYDNEYETKENKIKPRIELSHNSCIEEYNIYYPYCRSVRVDEGEAMRLELPCQVRRNRRLLF